MRLHKQKRLAFQLRLMKLARYLLVGMLGLSFAIEFLMLNLFSIRSTQYVHDASYQQPSDNPLVMATSIMTITVSQEYHAFLSYIKKKQEEKSQSKTENSQYVGFSLFFIERFSHQFEGIPSLERQVLNAHYQAPDAQKALSEIFHPPKV